jgi:hypothetical protein
MKSPPEEVGVARGRPAWVRWGANALGCALLAGAIFMALRHGAAAESDATLGAMWNRGVLRERWWMVAGLLVLPLLNYACSVFLVMVMTRPHVAPGRSLRLREMAALVGGAWLLNYLPLAPGLIGRAAYHARVQGIPVATTAKVLVQTVGVSVAALALVAGIAAVFAVLGAGAEHVIVVVLFVAMLLATMPLRVVLGVGISASARWQFPSAILVRVCDIGLWATRYALAFGLLGVILSPAESLAFAVVSQVAVLIPFLGNGLGVREWAVGIGARVVPATADAGRGLVSPIGLAADLINRAAEVLVAIPVGLISLAWLARFAHSGGHDRADAGADSPRSDVNG